MTVPRTYAVLGAPEAEFPLVFEAITAGAGRAGWRHGAMTDSEVYGAVLASDGDVGRAANDYPAGRIFFGFDVYIGDFRVIESRAIDAFRLTRPSQTLLEHLSQWLDNYLRRIDNDRTRVVDDADAQAARLVDDLGWVLQHQRDELLVRVGELEHRVDLLESQLRALRAALAEKDERLRRNLLGGVTKVIAGALSAVVVLGGAEIGAGAARLSARIGARTQVASALIAKAPPSVDLDGIEQIARTIQAECDAQ